MDIYTISTSEQLQLNRLLSEISQSYLSADNEVFLQESFVYSGDLPKGIKSHLYDLKNNNQHNGALIIRGFQSNKELPPTPKSWHPENVYTPNHDIDFLAVILSSILGDAFGFETQQNGKLIHDVVPIKGKEYFQAGYSSLGKLTFHTEDAFHPYKGEFLCFCCLKNPSLVGTTGAAVHQLKMPDRIKAILLQKRFYTLPDNTHITKIQEPSPHAILFGNPASPYICLDPDFTHAKEGDSEAKEALAILIKEIDSKMTEIMIEPGDFCFLDNFKWVHGRKPFVAKYDGHDRWLKRLNITTDLKKSARYKRITSKRIISSEPILYAAPN